MVVLANLAAGATTTRTLTAVVADLTLRPYRNVAEIDSDSADTYSAPGEPVTDVDSTPDADVSNDGNYGPIMSASAIDNVIDGPTPAIAFAGVGADAPPVGEDDADIADVDVPVTYDLALIKTGPTTLAADGSAVFTITVTNQGNVPSGVYDVTDTVPAGLVATDASDGGSLATPSSTVDWTALPSLAPGETATLTVTMSVTDYTLRPYLNHAEITADSADSYSPVVGAPVVDVDSVPDDLATSALDNTLISEAGIGLDAGFDDEDVATVTIDPAYDLALVKTGDTATTTYDGTVVFTVTVANQGNVPSGPFTVTDTLPAGMTFESASNGGVLGSDGVHVTWSLTSMPPDETASLTVTATVSDFTQRPFINSAEITADSAASYSLPYGPVLTDVDSAPDDAATSTVDNTDLDEAGLAGDTGFDDEDVARVDVPISYDLELVKTLDPGQTFHLGDTLGYTITVTNKSNVPSGLYSVQDALPDGLTFIEGSHGATAAGNLVTWTNLASLAPGGSASVTILVRLSDITKSSYVNVAAIIADGSAAMSTMTDPVTDVDSSPSLPTGDQRVTEDDRSVASLSLADVLAANATAPVPVALPRTGSDSERTITMALFAVAAGAVLTLGAHRRRKRSEHVG